MKIFLHGYVEYGHGIDMERIPFADMVALHTS